MIPINFQEPLKAERRTDGVLNIHSVFFTIQGEGPYVGRPAVFIRLAGCNLQCPGCDTEYTGGIGEISPYQLVARALSSFSLPSVNFLPLIVITGGEPFRQNVGKAIQLLLDYGFQIQVESNGTLVPDHIEGLKSARMIGSFGVVCSPKSGKIAADLRPYIIAYKYVGDAKNLSEKDGLPTSVLGMPSAPARPHAGYSGPIYLQPADEEGYSGFGHEEKSLNVVNQNAVIKSCMKFGYTLCIQTHKILNLE